MPAFSTPICGFCLMNILVLSTTVEYNGRICNSESLVFHKGEVKIDSSILKCVTNHLKDISTQLVWTPAFLKSTTIEHLKVVIYISCKNRTMNP